MKITLKKSPIGAKPNQRKTLVALGLRKIGHTVEKPDNDQIKGMVNTVQHLVSVEQ